MFLLICRDLLLARLFTIHIFCFTSIPFNQSIKQDFFAWLKWKLLRRPRNSLSNSQQETENDNNNNLMDTRYVVTAV